MRTSASGGKLIVALNQQRHARHPLRWMLAWLILRPRRELQLVDNIGPLGLGWKATEVTVSTVNKETALDDPLLDLQIFLVTMEEMRRVEGRRVEGRRVEGKEVRRMEESLVQIHRMMMIQGPAAMMMKIRLLKARWEPVS